MARSFTASPPARGQPADRRRARTCSGKGRAALTARGQKRRSRRGGPGRRVWPKCAEPAGPKTTGRSPAFAGGRPTRKIRRKKENRPEVLYFCCGA